MRKLFRRIREVSALLDRNNVGLIAAGIGFFATLAIFPALAALVLVWSVFADPGQIGEIMELVVEVVPPDVYGILNGQLVTLTTAASREALGWASLLSFAVAMWSARNGVGALMRGLNAVHRIGHRDSTWRRLAASLGLTLMLGGAALLTFATVVILPIFFSFIPLGTTTAIVTEMLRWLLSFLVVVGSLGLVYRYGPNRKGDRPGWLSPGAFVAAVLWLIVSIGFSYFLTNFGRYNEVYGSLGAAVALLMWFYLSAYVVLLGAALNAALERRPDWP